MSLRNNAALPLAALAVLALVAAPGQSVAQDDAMAEDQSVEGAWVVTNWEGPEESYEAQPGMFIFTGTHYAIMYVNASEARGGYDAEAGMTDEERTHAYQTLVANAGRYSVEGDQLTTIAYVAKDMNYMGDFPGNAQPYTIHFAGDVLHISYGEDTFRAGWTATLQKVEGMSME
ncbi:MAG: lipocalin-like domain-containing protein [Gemmatimonadota bacterium]